MAPPHPITCTDPAAISRRSTTRGNGRVRKPSTAAPATRKIFDPWNSASTGHQRAENRLSGSTSWRTSRSMKLGQQFRAGHAGGARLYDTVGAGSEHWGHDGRKENGGWEPGAPGLREPGWQDVRGLLRAKETKPTAGGPSQTCQDPIRSTVDEKHDSRSSTTDTADADTSAPAAIFHHLTIYINGSTAPRVGDHKLKRLLAEHGAGISIALGRRTVTHVIVGRPNGGPGGNGAGGGLAASKIQKEIARVGGCGVKYVSVDWVLDSISAGTRLPEARYQCVHVAHKGQRSVYGMFTRHGRRDGTNNEGKSTVHEGRRVDER